MGWRTICPSGVMTQPPQAAARFGSIVGTRPCSIHIYRDIPTTPFSLVLRAVLWNRNYFLRFRFLLLKSYGSGSDFWKSYGSGSGSYFRKVTVPVPAPYLDHKMLIFQEYFWNFFAFLHSKLFYKEKIQKFQQIYCKMWMKIFFNEGNLIHNFISSSGSGTVICYGSGSDFLTSYGSGSTSQKITVLTVPVPVP